MKRLSPEKLHVSYSPETGQDGPIVPRRYTLTHSDITGDLFLFIGADYDRRRLSNWYTRLMRDEVLAEWDLQQGVASLHVTCHVSGGLAFGRAGWRGAIFRRELPLVLEAFRFGDGMLYEAHPELDSASVRVHFHARQSRYNVEERWGTPADYL